MSRAKVKINSPGAARLLSCQAVASDLLRRAEAISDEASSHTSGDTMSAPPYVARQSSRGQRAAAVVITATPHGIRDNSKKNTLLKSLDAGR